MGLWIVIIELRGVPTLLTYLFVCICESAEARADGTGGPFSFVEELSLGD